MLTNTERQQIVEEVNAGTYGIDEALDDIAAAQKGEEVRKALYAEALVLNREGHAGSTDMIARQQIANLQTSVNGQISTLRTEVGDDIDDLETALNSGLATQNGKIAAQDATIANVVANYNVEYGSTELWASTGETGALAAETTVTLSEDVSHFDYIDIYSFCGNSNVLDTVPVDAKLQSNAGYALRWVNLSDPGTGTYQAYVRIVETKIKIIGTTLTIVHQVTYRNGESVSVSGAEITQSNRSTYVGELGIMKVVGRKITANTEVEDIRTGADGTEYESAGQAVRGQITEVKAQIPLIDATLATAGKAADAKATGDAIAWVNGRLGNFYLWENYATGTGAGAATTQTATFSTALQANKKYKISVSISPSKGTTGKVYLSSGGTIANIGAIAAGATSAVFSVEPQSICEAIRFNSTVNTETYTVTVEEEVIVVASKAELNEVSADVSELQEQIADLGYDAENIVTYPDSETVDEITWTAGYVSKSGTVSSSNTHSYSNKIPVSQGDVITSTANGNMFRFLCAYDANDTPVPDSGMSADFNAYTIPSGIASVVLSAYNTKLNNSVTKSSNVTAYVAPQKKIGSFSVSGNMNDGDEKKVPLVNVSKNTVQTFSADITSFDKIQIGRKTDSDYGYLEIDDTNITIKVLNSTDVVIPHGLTITNNINVRIIQNTDGQADPTKLYRGYIELSSNGQMFKTTDMNQMPQNYWTRAHCAPFVKSVGSVLANCSMSYIPCDIFKNIYMFGDSYFSFYTDRWTYYFANDGYGKNVLMNAFAGESSANAVAALRNILSLGVVPNYIIWCLGMNDGADSVDAPSTAWASGRDSFLVQCKKYGINPVFGTIPTVPNKSNEQKNAWIRNSGYPYIDFAKAVGAQADGTWYSGMLSKDNVHPTVAGGIALYGRVLTDFPQIAYLS